MRQRVLQVPFLIAIAWASWLAMMLVHEAGHVLGAVATGGRVERVVWHPLAMSRTDVSPNPHPLIEVLAGPVIGCLGPLLMAAITQFAWRRGAYLAWFFAGFCLVANGVYLGVGVIDAVGDAKQLISLGLGRWLLGAFGGVTVSIGFLVWHRVSPRFGFGPDAVPIERRHLAGVVVLAALLTIAGFVFGRA